MTEADISAADRRLTAALPPGSLYAVGGRVRDEIRASLDGEPRVLKDLDYIAVGLELDEVLGRLNAAGRATVVGSSFPVVKWTDGTVTADVALPRRERSTGTGHGEFVIEAAGPAVTLEEDLARRDFRINMIARALPAGQIVDPFNGRGDIIAKRVDILQPRAFDEDPLRMLRAAQFAARFEYSLTARTAAAMEAAGALIATVSAERIRDELEKLLGAAAPSGGFEILRRGGLLTHILPELLEGVGVEQNEWHAFDVYRHTLAVMDAAPAGDLLVRWAALLHDIAKPRTKDGPHFYGHQDAGAAMAREILGRLRVPGDAIALVATLVQYHLYATDPVMKDATVRRFIARVGRDVLPRLFALRHADIAGTGLPLRDDANERFEKRVAGLLAQAPPLNVKDLSISGHEVLDLLIREGRLPAGSRGGPAVGEVLSRVLEAVLDTPRLTRDEQLALAGQYALDCST